MESLGVEQKLYKLTSEEFTTYNNTKWGENVTHYAPGNGLMCTNRWLHAYENPYLAIIMDPAHGDFGKRAVLWESSGIVGISDGLKVGCKKLTTIKIIDKPEISIEFRITFAIKSSLKIYHGGNYVTWANNWLNSIDRSAYAATDAAADAAVHAARAANDATDAADASTAAAYAAANAAATDAANDAATAAAYAAYAARAADVAVHAANAAADAVHAANADAYPYAYAAANVANAATYVANAANVAKINFIEIIEEILKETTDEQTIK